MNSQDAEAHYSEIEIEEILLDMGDAEIVRILQNYRTLGCEQRSGLTAHDILQHAMSQALSIERPWPRDVSAVSYLTQSGRSNISNEAEKRSKQLVTPTIDEIITNEDRASVPTSATAKLSHSSPQSGLEESQSTNIVMEWIGNIRQLFADDKDASCFIEQKIECKKKSDIMTICELTDQVYRNVEKRIKDKVRKRFPNGLPWWEIEQ